MTVRVWRNSTTATSLEPRLQAVKPFFADLVTAGLKPRRSRSWMRDSPLGDGLGDCFFPAALGF